MYLTGLMPSPFSILRAFFDRPYVIVALAFLGAFVVAYSTFGNFGLLARQRVQAMPLYLILVCSTARSEEEQSIS